DFGFDFGFAATSGHLGAGAIGSGPRYVNVTWTFFFRVRCRRMIVAPAGASAGGFPTSKNSTMEVVGSSLFTPSASRTFSAVRGPPSLVSQRTAYSAAGGCGATGARTTSGAGFDAWVAHPITAHTINGHVRFIPITSVRARRMLHQLGPLATQP